MRKTIITLAASAALCLAMLPGAASARGGHGGGMRGMGMHGMGMHGAMAFHGQGFVRHDFDRRHDFDGRRHRFDGDRFAFRHHRFRHFRDGVFFASYLDDDCYVARHVLTQWGWRWRRVWVCG